MAKVLQSVGLDVQHESRGRDGISQWHSVGKSYNHNKYRKRVHLVREWWKVIRSVAYTFTTGAMKHIYYNKVIPDKEVNLHNAMRYWHKWNKMAESQTDIRIRVEDEVNSPVLWEYLGIEWKPGTVSAMPRDINTRVGRYQSISKAEIIQMMVDTDAELYDKIVALAKEYGYEA